MGKWLLSFLKHHKATESFTPQTPNPWAKWISRRLTLLVCTSFDHWLPVRFLFIIKLANMAPTLTMLRKIPFLPSLQTVYTCHIPLGYDSKYSHFEWIPLAHFWGERKKRSYLFFLQTQQLSFRLLPDQDAYVSPSVFPETNEKISSSFFFFSMENSHWRNKRQRCGRKTQCWGGKERNRREEVRLEMCLWSLLTCPFWHLIT